MANSVHAQGIRAYNTWYLYPKVGLTQYTGDQDRGLLDLWDKDGSEVEGLGIDQFPWGAGLELGYHFNNGWGLGLEGSIGFYGTAADDRENGDTGNAVNAEQLKLIGRYTFGYGTSPVAPFLEIGAFGTNAVEDNYEAPGDYALGFGPLIGLGLDIRATDHLSVMIEAQEMASFPDNAFDGDNRNPYRDPGDEGGFLEKFDALSFLGIGVKYNFKSAVIAPIVTGITCPTDVVAGSPATFTAMVEPGATEPLEYRWEFGAAGATGTGLTTTYTYDEEGTYTTTFTVTGPGGSDVETCVVNVARAPVNASIVTLTANPSTFTACEPTTVTFNANVAGDEPMTYEWDFGDGNTGTGPNPTHTYTEAGNYTVTLTLTGATGVPATRTTTVTVEECVNECMNITELNSVYFPRNSSTLTTEGRAALGENLEVLRNCPELCVRIEGWSAPGERNAQQLSEDRARAVAQFYQDNGIAASRTAAMGMGRVQGQTTKKEGGAQNQRADSIPLPCDQLNQ
ncbi:MAG TPA: PKD domain-containing protein [Rhodothermales bacterium]|nr:PKD domain-containing protein [Rhodothermales bacterium]